MCTAHDSPTAANLVAPFSSAHDLTRFQSDWSWVQFEFATVKGFSPLRKERIEDPLKISERRKLTEPAKEVCGRTFWGLCPVVIVGQDDHEPLGGKLVAPLPRPEHQFVYTKITTSTSTNSCVTKIARKNFTSHHRSPRCHSSRWYTAGQPPPPLCRSGGQTQGLQPAPYQTTLLLCHFPNDILPFLVAGKLSCCKLAGRRMGLRKTRGRRQPMWTLGLLCWKPSRRANPTLLYSTKSLGSQPFLCKGTVQQKIKYLNTNF